MERSWNLSRTMPGLQRKRKAGGRVTKKQSKRIRKLLLFQEYITFLLKLELGIAKDEDGARKHRTRKTTKNP